MPVLTKHRNGHSNRIRYSSSILAQLDGDEIKRGVIGAKQRDQSSHNNGVRLQVSPHEPHACKVWMPLNPGVNTLISRCACSRTTIFTIVDTVSLTLAPARPAVSREGTLPTLRDHQFSQPPPTFPRRRDHTDGLTTPPPWRIIHPPSPACHTCILVLRGAFRRGYVQANLGPI
jgi:hypothetical protein